MKALNSEDSRKNVFLYGPQMFAATVMLAVVLCFSLLLLPNPVQALEIEPDKSYVLVNAYNTQRRGRIEYLVFESVDSDARFRAKTNSKFATEVEPGNYFLSSIKAKDSYTETVEPLEVSPPTDKVGTIVIQKGSVTYIGDWGASVDLGVEPRVYDWGVAYELDTIKSFGRKYPELKEHKLNIANNLADVYQVEWSDIDK